MRPDVQSGSASKGLNIRNATAKNLIVFGIELICYFALLEATTNRQDHKPPQRAAKILVENLVHTVRRGLASVARRLRASPPPAVGDSKPQLRMHVQFGDQVMDENVVLPQGYRFLDSHKNAMDGWLELLNRDGDFGTLTKESVKSEILSSLIPNGAVLVASGDEIVACASACFAARFRPDALMNYVLVRSDHRGHGLGRAVSAEAMRRSRKQGYPGMVLQTDDTRDSAIAMYLALGFHPVTDCGPDMPGRWADVLARLS